MSAESRPGADLDRMLRMILTSRVYDVAQDTPLERAPRLSRRLGHDVLFKREDLQACFSFKLRGAYNRIVRFSKEERWAGVIAASAGNHAQGVAFSARHLGLRAKIVMPQTTPDIKIAAVRELGAEIVLYGDSYADAQAHCDALVEAEGMTFVHPFDDLQVIAGQGTIGMELLRHRLGDLSAVFVPVGGGGLIAGIGAYIKAVRPDIRVIGVEPFEADAMYQSLLRRERVELAHVGIFADGVAVRRVGAQAFAIAQQTVDEVVRVSNDEVCGAIRDVFEDTRAIMEPAGALAVAGLMTWTGQSRKSGLRLAAVLSGANMNFDRLRFVAERAELGEAREAIFGVTIPERPGSFLQFCRLIGSRVVTEFNYRLSGRSEAQIFVGISTRSRADASDLAEALRSGGYPTVDLTENEMAKLHVRHMVGGRSADARAEQLYRFEFPERPGALMQFLDALGGRWNISLFHYRNHGADFGRVLVGFEVPASDTDRIRAVLDALGYAYQPEHENAAYEMFLR